MLNTLDNLSPGRIVVSTSEGKYFFQPQEIVRLEASSNYTYIYFTNRARMFTARLLKDFASSLEPMGFIRTHRTHLVNKAYIAHVGRDGKILMRDDSIAEISRRQKSEVLRLLQN